MAIADDAPVVVSYVQNRELRVLDARDGSIERALPDPVPQTSAWRVDVDPSGDLIAILSWDNRVWLWKWRDEPLPRPVATLPGSLSPDSVMRITGIVEFAPGGDRILVGHGQGGLLLLDTDGEFVATLHPGRRDPVRPSYLEVRRSWTADGQTLALATDAGPCLFDATTGERVVSGFDISSETLTSETLTSETLTSVALNADGTRLATGHWTGVVALYDVETREQLWSYTHIDPIVGMHGELDFISIGDIEFRPDGGLLAVTVNTLISGLLLDAATGERTWQGPACGGRMGTPAEIVWQPSGRSFVFTYVTSGELWQVILGEKGASEVATQIMWESGTLPDIGWNGTAVYVADDAVCGVDSDWTMLWRTPVAPLSRPVAE